MKNPSIIQTIKIFFQLLKEAFQELMKNDVLRMAGSTAFFTTFALPPILVIIIQALGLVLNPRMISRKLFQGLADTIGKESVDQVIQVLRAMRKLAENWFITIAGFIFLLFVATTLFKVIKSSLNQVWKVRVVERQNFWFGLKNRLQAIAVILVAGILFVTGLLTEGMQAYLGEQLSEYSPAFASYFNSAFSYMISILIVTAWFAVIFRFLPDGKPQWRIALGGALLTSLLFALGKLILHWLLSYSSINSIYGASASIVLLLLFVFYCSMILYYGAAFTKVWGIKEGRPIKPDKHAIQYKVVEVHLGEEDQDKI